MEVDFFLEEVKTRINSEFRTVALGIEICLVRTFHLALLKRKMCSV